MLCKSAYASQTYEADLALLTGGATIENDVDATGRKFVYKRWRSYIYN